MKIAVTGATGFIGENLLKILLDKKYDIYAIVRVTSSISEVDKRAHFFHYDGNVDNLLKFFEKEQFDGVIHLASFFLASHTPMEIPKMIASNITFATEILEACKISKVKWFLNTGTFWQHYHTKEYNPVNLYAATKEAFEKIAKYYTQTSDLIFVTIKLNDTFGPNDTRKKIFNFWNKIAKTGEVLEMSEGKQIIDISYIQDVIYAYELLIEYLNSNNRNDFQNKCYVVTSNERVTLRELASIFEKATNTKLNIKWGSREYREREVMLPYEGKESVPNWEQHYTLQEAIKKTVGEI